MKFLSNKQSLYSLLVNIGAILLVASVVINGVIGEDFHRMAGGFIVLGVLLIGYFTHKRGILEAERKDPELLRKRNIDMNDERNIIIRHKALANANKFLLGLIFAGILVLSFFDVGWYIPATLGVIVVINGVFFIIYYRYYNKRL